MMLPIVMEFNAPCTGEKFKNIAEALGVDTTGMDQETYRKAAVDAVRQLSIDVGIPTKLDKLKVPVRVRCRRRLRARQPQTRFSGRVQRDVQEADVIAYDIGGLFGEDCLRIHSVI